MILRRKLFTTFITILLVGTTFNAYGDAGNATPFGTPAQVNAPVAELVDPTKTDIKITWTKLTDLQSGGSPIIGYQAIPYAGPDFSVANVITCTTASTNDNCTVKGLAYHTTYRFKILATNSNGNSLSEFSNPVPTNSIEQFVHITGEPSGYVFGDPDFQLTATADSGLPVTWSVIEPSPPTNICTVDTSGVVHFLKAGSCEVKALQDGAGSNFGPAYATTILSASVVANISISRATNVQGVSATLNANSSFPGEDLTPTFCVSTSELITSQCVLPTDVTIGSVNPNVITSTSNTSISSIASGLKPGTIYYYWAKVTGATSGATSTISSFITATGPSLSLSGPTSSTVGSSTAISLTATGGSGSYTTWDHGNIPDGLVFSPGIFTATISGTPTLVASTPTWVSVTDSGGLSTTYSFTIEITPAAPSKKPQIINTEPISTTLRALDPDFNLNATSSSGLFLFYASNSPQVCKINSLGIVSLLTEGLCSITVSQPGNNEYYGASKLVTIKIDQAKKIQEINNQVVPNPAYLFEKIINLNASSSSGLPLTYESNSPNICEVSNSGDIKYIQQGNCSIIISQLGNKEFQEVEKNINFEIKLSEQNISSELPDDPTYVGNSKFNLNASSSSGLPLTYESNSPNICEVSNLGEIITLSEGKCSITITQAGNSEYKSTSKLINFKVSLMPQIISIGALPMPSLVSGTPFNIVGTSTSGLPVSYNSTKPEICEVTASGEVRVINEGICNIEVAQKGNNQFAEAQNIVQFKTAIKFSITLEEFLNIQSNSATAVASAIWPGIDSKIQFCVSERNFTPNCDVSPGIKLGEVTPTILNSKSGDTFQVEISGLRSNTNYYVWAFAQVGNKLFKTLVRKLHPPVGPTVVFQGNTTYMVNTPITLVFKATGGSGSYSNWKITGLPNSKIQKNAGNTFSVSSAISESGIYLVDVSVQDRNGMSTNLKIPLTIESRVPVTIESPRNVSTQPINSRSTLVMWQPVENAKSYIVGLRNKTICETSETKCLISELLGPNSQLTVAAISAAGVKSIRALSTYKAPEKPIMVSTVNFDLNKSKLKSSDILKITKLAKLLSSEGFTNLQVSGFTDSQGNDTLNTNLSADRAKNTYNFLQKILSKSSLSVSLLAQGSSNPVATNKTKEGQAANRRAVISIK